MEKSFTLLSHFGPWKRSLNFIQLPTDCATPSSLTRAPTPRSLNFIFPIKYGIPKSLSRLPIGWVVVTLSLGHPNIARHRQSLIEDLGGPNAEKMPPRDPSYNIWFTILYHEIKSMCGIKKTYIYIYPNLPDLMVNVGKYYIHGSYEDVIYFWHQFL